ncbi:Spo0E family sporulation regulatory protein-aspartic acid phosphatase [Clostridium botulinum]|nr:Spo0E family sporulation regulatory protein-aspartic acid phosphatase [Clostridium botulinum]MBO0549729.1 Spo0E family sporulation regulatory protein-aspartic acid phosphatase [Clostridium botulinum]
MIKEKRNKLNYIVYKKNLTSFTYGERAYNK